MRFSLLDRKVHYWASIAVALPLLLIIVTGILLHLKKDVTWIQPETKKGRPGELTLSFSEVLERARTVPEASIAEWSDIDRLDVRPEAGLIKVRAKNRWEIQIDAASGEILQVAYRRSDLIEDLHDGSFFLGRASVWVFLFISLLLLGLLGTGLYLFALPYWVRRRKADSP